MPHITERSHSGEARVDEQKRTVREVAFITGAGSGIGRATALAFAREGAKVVAVDVSERNTRHTVRLIEGAGGRSL